MPENEEIAYNPRMGRVVGYAVIMIFMFGLAGLWIFLPNTSPKDYLAFSQIPADKNDAGYAAAVEAAREEAWRFLQLLFILILNYVGFPLLMVYPRRASFTVLGFAYKVASLSFICIIFFHSMACWYFDDEHVHLVHVVLEASFGVAACLIIFSSMLGNLSHFQTVVIAIVASFMYVVNTNLMVRTFKVMDVGGSILVHCFGGVFALACSTGIQWANHLANRADAREHPEEPDDAPWRTGDMAGFAGTLVLFVTWPAFAAGLTPMESFFGSGLNCLICLCSSCVAGFIGSALARELHTRDGTFRFENVDLINATLAGGVACGASVDFSLPFGVFVILGLVVGLVSAFGFTFLTPFLRRTIGLKDSCGVINLHVIPSIIGIIWATCIIPVVLYDDDNVLSYAVTANPHTTILKMVAIELSGMVATIVIAVGSGLLCGLGVGKLDRLPVHKSFDDRHYFIGFDDEEGFGVEPGMATNIDITALSSASSLSDSDVADEAPRIRADSASGTHAELMGLADQVAPVEEEEEPDVLPTDDIVIDADDEVETASMHSAESGDLVQ